MRYLIANFKKEIPAIPGMFLISSVSHYQIYKLTEESWDTFPFNDVDWEEITELEGVEAWKYYSEVRGYRSAYSDVEGLEPDPDELAKGKRKTKVYITPEIEKATITLMKRVFKRIVIEEFNNRESNQEQTEILSLIDSLETIKEINYHKERLLGIEMPKKQLQELMLWDDETNSRIGRMYYNLGF
jgi:hypothetical protein